MNHGTNAEGAVTDDLISKARWTELAGVAALKPTPDELAQDMLRVKASCLLWQVTFSSGKTAHVLSADGDLTSLEQAVAAWHGSGVQVLSVTRLGPVQGTVTIADDAMIDKLCRMEVSEEIKDRITRQLEMSQGSDEPSGVKVSFVTQQGETIVHELTEAQAREHERLKRLYGPSKRDEMWSQACKEAHAASLEGIKMFKAVTACVQRQRASLLAKDADTGPGYAVEIAAPGNPIVIAHVSTKSTDARHAALAQPKTERAKDPE